jgi:uncharacterized protein YkwD
MMRLILIAACLLGLVTSASAENYASQISRYRRAHGQSAVKADAHLAAIAMRQARAMSAAGKISHFVAGSFVSRIGKLRNGKAAENLAAGFLTFRETMKQWENSPGHRENLLMPGARKVGVASVRNPGSPYGMFWAMVITD